MNIVTTYYTHKPGGFCTRLYRMMNALVSAGHKVKYLVLDKPPAGKLDLRIEVKLIPFPFKSRSGVLFWALFTAWLPFYIFWEALKNKPDCFALFGSYYSAASLIPSKILGVKIFLFMRSLPYKINKINLDKNILTFVASLYERLGVIGADKIICMTKVQAAEIQATVNKKLDIEILPNNLPERKKIVIKRSDKIKFVTSGVLTKRKNLDVLIEAIRAIQDSELYIVGDGVEKKRLEAVARGLDNVIFTGWLEDTTQILESAHLYIHPALHEGIANSILEALALGLPVIASDIPEHREILDSKLLFKPSDVSALTDKLIEFKENPEIFEKISLETGKKLNFDWDLKITELLQTTSK